jgi:hypothetical protein
MQQRWRRLGRVIGPQDLRGGWSASHASCPIAMPLGDNEVRVFFSSRDARNRSHLGSVDLALRDDVVERASSVRGPLLSPGPRGAFDADGVSVGSLVREEDRLLAFYVGWSVGVSAPFANFIGMAVGNLEGTRFDKPFLAPIVGRSEVNPFSLGYPWVLKVGGRWRMWFGSHLAWGPKGVEMTHVIKTADSEDGITWLPSPRIAVDLYGARDPAEFAITRPVVRPGPDGYAMWYGRRYAEYRLGYATSDDGDTWIRRDEDLVLLGSPGDWEASEATYPYVFDHGVRRYLLYNGDGYGRTGFGLAILE